jgi:hypothetical protein
MYFIVNLQIYIQIDKADLHIALQAIVSDCSIVINSYHCQYIQQST